MKRKKKKKEKKIKVDRSLTSSKTKEKKTLILSGKSPVSLASSTPITLCLLFCVSKFLFSFFFSLNSLVN